MPSFYSDNITIAAKTPTAHAKLFQIAFQKRDGSVMVTFPYYRDAHGLLCHATLKSGTQYPNQLDLTDSGQFTSSTVLINAAPPMEVDTAAGTLRQAPRDEPRETEGHGCDEVRYVALHRGQSRAVGNLWVWQAL
jgi:hypothetical protein